MTKFFGYQRGPRGPEPVTFNDEPPQSKAHKLALIDKPKPVPDDLADLPLSELAERMKSK